MSWGWRFWRKGDTVKADHMQEVLDSGWVPLPPGSDPDQAAVGASAAAPQGESSPDQPATDEPELLERFYANQDC